MNNNRHTILIVDDDSVNRMVMELSLGINNYNILQAENGLDAIEKYNPEMVNVVLMDIAMPIMNGIEATRIIREKNRNQIIIGVSAFDEDSITLELFDYYFKKPVNFKKLNDLLKEIL